MLFLQKPINKTNENKMKAGLLLFFLIISLTVFANESIDTTKTSADSIRFWKTQVNSGIHFNQVSLVNWAKGGESSLSGKANVKIKANYKKDNFNFQNNLKLLYGIMGTKELNLQKIDDQIYFRSSAGLKAFKKWFYSIAFDIKTQFSNGYKYPNDSVVLSRFFAPAYFTLSAGMDYKPSDEFSLLFSPASGKLTLVYDQELANKGAFGVTPAIIDDSTGTVLEEGKNQKAEFGINLVVKFEKELIKNIKAESTLNLYNNYLDEDMPNRWNIDMDWETNLTFSVNEHITTELYLHMIYDHDIKIPIYEIVNGENTQVGAGPRLQLNQSFGVGLSFKF